MAVDEAVDLARSGDEGAHVGDWRVRFGGEGAHVGDRRMRFAGGESGAELV